MTTGMQNQKAAVDSGQWLLYRYNPALEEQGKNPLLLDSRAPTLPLDMYMNMENRFRLLAKTRPEQAKAMLELAEEDVRVRRSMYEYLAGRPLSKTEAASAAPEPAAKSEGNGHNGSGNGHKQDLEAIGPAVASKN
jgi:pyruvate-ferredoxin/flavodoxin oxidoreductase